MKFKEKNYLRKRKKSESTVLTRQTWDSCHEIGRKKVDAF
jgi:hypothetical protein